MQRTDLKQVKLVKEHLFVRILICECFACFLKVDFLFFDYKNFWFGLFFSFLIKFIRGNID